MDIRLTVVGNCGRIHASFEEWQRCRSCDTPAIQYRRAIDRLNRMTDREMDEQDVKAALTSSFNCMR